MSNRSVEERRGLRNVAPCYTEADLRNAITRAISEPRQRTDIEIRSDIVLTRPLQLPAIAPSPRTVRITGIADSKLMLGPETVTMVNWGEAWSDPPYVILSNTVDANIDWIFEGVTFGHPEGRMAGAAISMPEGGIAPSPIRLTLKDCTVNRCEAVWGSQSPTGTWDNPARITGAIVDSLRLNAVGVWNTTNIGLQDCSFRSIGAGAQIRSNSLYRGNRHLDWDNTVIVSSSPAGGNVAIGCRFPSALGDAWTVVAGGTAGALYRHAFPADSVHNSVELLNGDSRSAEWIARSDGLTQDWVVELPGVGVGQSGTWSLEIGLLDNAFDGRNRYTLTGTFGRDNGGDPLIQGFHTINCSETFKSVKIWGPIYHSPLAAFLLRITDGVNFQGSARCRWSLIG